MLRLYVVLASLAAACILILGLILVSGNKPRFLSGATGSAGNAASGPGLREPIYAPATFEPISVLASPTAAPSHEAPIYSQRTAISGITSHTTDFAPTVVPLPIVTQPSITTVGPQPAFTPWVPGVLRSPTPIRSPSAVPPTPVPWPSPRPSSTVPYSSVKPLATPSVTP
jgi:hypothetical protein